MKKIAALLLILAMLMSLSACGTNEREPLVTEDGRKIVRVLTEPSLESHVKSIVNTSREEMADTQVEIEVLPFEPTERESALTRIRTEIIAGEGPDVFVLTTGTKLLSYDGENILGTEDALLTDVTASLELNIFLPLDEYLSGEYLKFDEHFEVLMNSGRTDEGQEVLPLTYEYLIYFMDKSKIDGDYTDFSTLESLKNCTDERLKNFIGLQCSEWAPGYFTDFVDYDTGELKLSYEEFRAIILELHEISKWYTESYQEPEDFPSELFLMEYYDMRRLEEEFDKYLPVVPPNINGGITVDITSYVAVNRNCINREQSVRFAELFFCGESPRIDDKGVMIGMDTQKTPFDAMEGTGVESFLLENVDRITYVNYSSRMGEPIKRLINTLCYAEEDEKETLITETYRKLQMMAAE